MKTESGGPKANEERQHGGVTDASRRSEGQWLPDLQSRRDCRCWPLTLSVTPRVDVLCCLGRERHRQFQFLYMER